MTDVFRKEYKPLSDKQKHAMDLIKEKADELLDVIIKCNCLNPDIRHAELARNNLNKLSCGQSKRLRDVYLRLTGDW
jgi:hypothetical protein